MKVFFDLTVRVLIYCTGIFFPNIQNSQAVQGLSLAILLLVLFAPSKYIPLPTSLLGKSGAMHPQNSRLPREHQGLSMFPSGIIWRQRAQKRFDNHDLPPLMTGPLEIQLTDTLTWSCKPEEPGKRRRHISFWEILF